MSPVTLWSPASFVSPSSPHLCQPPLQPPVPPPARSQPSASPPHSSTLSAAPLAPHHSTAAANLVHVFMHLFKYLLSKEHKSKSSSSPCNCDTFPNGLGAARPVAGAPVSPPSISRLLHSTLYSALLSIHSTVHCGLLCSANISSSIRCLLANSSVSMPSCANVFAIIFTTHRCHDLPSCANIIFDHTHCCGHLCAATTPPTIAV